MKTDVKIVPLISNVSVTDDDNIAVVTTYQGSLSLCIYAEGFLEIAIIAVQHAVKNQAAIDSTTPSILYAIRHATELFLKYVIADLAKRHQRKEVSPEGHKLLDLFNNNKQDIQIALEIEENAEYSSFRRKAWLAEFEAIICELEKVDNDGTKLRYPTEKDTKKKKGEPNLGGTMNVSLKQVELFARHAETCFSKFTSRNT